jgi:6-pyruvoyl-tetrahydropterin synthase
MTPDAPQTSIFLTISLGHRLPTDDATCPPFYEHNIQVRCVVSTSGFLNPHGAGEWLQSILSSLDHTTLLSKDDPLVDDERLTRLRRIVLLSVEPTTASLAQLIMNELSTYCHVVSVAIREADVYSATCTQIDDSVYRIPSTGE